MLESICFFGFYLMFKRDNNNNHNNDFLKFHKVNIKMQIISNSFAPDKRKKILR